MKKYIRLILCACVLSMTLGLTSCESYLERSEESIVNEQDAYKNFFNFQGFTEELYYCIPLFYNN